MQQRGEVHGAKGSSAARCCLPSSKIARMKKRSWILATLLCISAATTAGADAQLQSFVESTVAEARARTGVPAIGVMIQVDGKVEAQVAAGVRALGEKPAVTRDDLWHLGADTKA